MFRFRFSCLTLKENFAQSPPSVDLKQNFLVLNKKDGVDDSSSIVPDNTIDGENEEAVKLHVAVRWLAHRPGSNKGLEKAQHKLKRNSALAT